MTSLERVLTTAKHKIPDRVPIFILLSTTGAKLSGLSYKEYYSSGKQIAKMQIRMQRELDYDCLLGLTYLAQEAEPFGSNVIFYDDGDPNIAKPAFFDDPNKILENEIPDPFNDPILKESLILQKFLAEYGKGKIPILGVGSGIFSLPSLLLGASKWYEMVLMEPDKSKSIVSLLENYIIQLSNAKIENGADIIILVDGLASASSIPSDVFEEFVQPSLTRIIKGIKAPVVFGTAGGEIEPLIKPLIDSGVFGITLSFNDELANIKVKYGAQTILLGNINNLEIVDWPPSIIEKVVTKCIEDGAQQGGYILMNQHTFTTELSIDKIKHLIQTAKKFGIYNE